MFPKRWPLIVALFPLLLPAQERGDLQQILQRLDQLEQENHNLPTRYMRCGPKSLVRGGRPPDPALPQVRRHCGTPANTPSEPINVSPVPLEERVGVLEQRTEEALANQGRGGAAWPVTLAGMVLFNSFINGRANGGAQAAGGCAYRQYFARRGQLEPKHHWPAPAGAARARRWAGARVDGFGPMGRHVEFPEPPGSVACRHHSSGLEKHQHNGRPGQALGWAARPGLAGASGILAPDLRREPVAVVTAGAF